MKFNELNFEYVWEDSRDGWQVAYYLTIYLEVQANGAYHFNE